MLLFRSSGKTCVLSAKRRTGVGKRSRSSATSVVQLRCALPTQEQYVPRQSRRPEIPNASELHQEVRWINSSVVEFAGDRANEAHLRRKVRLRDVAGGS